MAGGLALPVSVSSSGRSVGAAPPPPGPGFLPVGASPGMPQVLPQCAQGGPGGSSGPAASESICSPSSLHPFSLLPPSTFTPPPPSIHFLLPLPALPPPSTCSSSSLHPLSLLSHLTPQSDPSEGLGHHPLAPPPKSSCEHSRGLLTWCSHSYYYTRGWWFTLGGGGARLTSGGSSAGGEARGTQKPGQCRAAPTVERTHGSRQSPIPTAPPSSLGGILRHTNKPLHERASAPPGPPSRAATLGRFYSLCEGKRPQSI